MESVNFFSGYGKLFPFEAQIPTQHRKIPKPLFVSLLMLLTIFMAAMLGGFLHQSSTGSRLSPSPSLSITITSPQEAIRAICSVTQHADSCFAAISSIADASPPQTTDPELLLKLSLQAAVNEATTLSSLPKTLVSKTNHSRAVSALRDCAGVFDDAVGELKRSASSMDVGPDEKMLTEAKISDMQTWIGSAMSNQETCLNWLEDIGSTALGEVRTKVHKSREYMSNTLAILTNIHTVLCKFDLAMH